MPDDLETSLEDDLYEALWDGDADYATLCVNLWHEEGGDVADLVREPVRALLKDVCHTSWLFALNEALTKSNLPETDAWKQSARERYEREMAERFDQEQEALGLIEPVATGKRDNSTQTAPTIPEPKVDVLSSLTTTQTTRLADGTVTTKVVLKQRFTDGREETHEKVHTYQDQLQQQKDHLEEDEHVGKRSNGWFWT